ncbi:hypothetical protein LTR56_007645 [Elasticomyces elasticus]|nr:hypothetical protein LTR56_007645 [Elasticomyces elasticus]KAK3665346.1 hypothetical protein LTR22_003868 [Elasticomyces elasticus]KAK4929681.1 hypothetical protein LTR49_003639 [Elasticomyces elasticus]KAK5761099.1 hypothetical protein LTS12_008776 [Elasticomyces elasticus]
MPPPPQQPPPSIPLIAIGITRPHALATSTALTGSPYHLAAVLDLTETPSAYQFSPQNLGAVLWALHPRPLGLVTGTAVSSQDLEGIKPVWEEYVRDALEVDGGKGCWVKLSDWHATTGPPPPGWEKEILRQLDEVFR